MKANEGQNAEFASHEKDLPAAVALGATWPDDILLAMLQWVLLILEAKGFCKNIDPLRKAAAAGHLSSGKVKPCNVFTPGRINCFVALAHGTI